MLMECAEPIQSTSVQGIGPYSPIYTP